MYFIIYLISFYIQENHESIRKGASFFTIRAITADERDLPEIFELHKPYTLHIQMRGIVLEKDSYISPILLEKSCEFSIPSTGANRNLRGESEHAGANRNKVNFSFP